MEKYPWPVNGGRGKPTGLPSRSSRCTRATDAARLAALLAGTDGHVNLIPVNAVQHSAYRQSPRVAAFAQSLADKGVTATVRRTLGADIAAACGQLRMQHRRANEGDA